MAEVFSIISIISFIAAAVLLGITILLWFVFKVPNLIGDLSGRNARKSIDMLRSNNASKNKAVVKREKENKDFFDEKRAKVETDEKETSTLELENETALLMEEKNIDEFATASLDRKEIIVPRIEGGMELRMIKSVVCIHTEEVIDV